MTRPRLHWTTDNPSGMHRCQFQHLCVLISLIEAEWRIYVSLNWVIIGSDNGLSPDRRQATIWTSAGILLIGPLGTNFSEILIGIQTFSFKKLHLKTSSAKWRLFCLGLNPIWQTLHCVSPCGISRRFSPYNHKRFLYCTTVCPGGFWSCSVWYLGHSLFLREFKAVPQFYYSCSLVQMSTSWRCS